MIFVKFRKDDSDFVVEELRNRDEAGVFVAYLISEGYTEFYIKTYEERNEKE